MRDVRLGHEQTIVADLRQHAAAGSAAMDGDKLSDVIAPADARFRRLALYFRSWGGRPIETKGKT